MQRTSEHALRDLFEDRLVVITGGSSGIGFAIAQRLVTLRARVVLVADRPQTLGKAVHALGGEAARVWSIVCDLSDPEAVQEATAVLRRQHGVPDILINNAGYAVYRTFEQSDPDEIDRLLRVNFSGHLLFTKGVLGGMIERRRGHIVSIASVAGLFTLTPNAVYGASKSGIITWSRALQAEVHRYGVRVSVVCPGRVETPFFDHETFRQRKARRETRLTVTLPKVVDAVLDAIRRDRAMVIVPRYWGWFARTIQFVPYGLSAYHALLRRRVEDLYEQ